MFTAFFVPVAAILARFLPPAAAACRCIPGQSCWPSDEDWQALNVSTSGRLIKNDPVADVCYPGPRYSQEACDYVHANWMNATFQLDHPTGYQFPVDAPCPPTLTLSNGTCSLGNNPVYTINATEDNHVAEGISFARKRNLRLVIRNTGHDLSGRSTGFGSLQIWLKYLRAGIDYSDKFSPSQTCELVEWQEASFTIRGGYEWSEVYAEAANHNKIVVGGGTPTVGTIGGWMQGGGHSPASHDYGLGADQVLEATVMLADGRVVLTSPCHEPLLFHAIRGGGGGTYGVVLSATIKAYPTRNVTTNSFTVAARTLNDTADFLAALTTIYAASPSLLDAGFSGFGIWSMNGLGPLTPHSTPTYTHVLSAFDVSRSYAQQVFTSLEDSLRGSIYIDSSIQQYSTYAEGLASNPFTNSSQAASLLLGYGSRFLDKYSLTSNLTALHETLETIAGSPSEGVFNTLAYVGGGQVFRDASQSNPSAINAAWRRTYLHSTIIRMWTTSMSGTEVDAIHSDITYNKVAALKKLAPDTGAYMNEADRFDPDYVDDFFGAENYQNLLGIKKLYDPEDVFYCPTCVGSTIWAVNEVGALCRV